MKSIYVADLNKGMTITGETFAVQEVTLGETKAGKPFYKVTLLDKTGSVAGQIWEDKFIQIDRKSLKEGNVVMIDASVDEYKGKLQLTVSKLTRVDQSVLDEYIEASDFDLDQLWQELKDYVGKIKDDGIKAFFEKLFSDEELSRKYKVSPAAEMIHHSFRGGLLEHVVEMLDIASVFGKYYPEANFDLVIGGIILHDIGKLYEMEPVGTVVQKTTEGKLLGHIAQSYELLITKGREILSESAMLHLKHIVLSHHGSLEFGSPVVPSTIEAAIVHAADDSSSNVRIFQKVLRKNRGRGADFSEFDNILRTRVYLNSDLNDNKDTSHDSEQITFA